MGKPGTSLDIGGDGLHYFWRLGMKELEQCNDMLRSIHNTMFHLNFEEHGKVNITYKMSGLNHLVQGAHP